MKKISSKAINSGIIAGVVLVFFELINFSSTLSIMIEKIFNGGKSDANVYPVYLGVVVGLIVFFTAMMFFRGHKTVTILQGLSCGALIGCFSGLMISILNTILGIFLSKGIDVRTYLDALAPEVIQNFLFQKDVKTAVGYYLGLCIVSALAGILCEWISIRTQQPRKMINSIKLAAVPERTNKFMAKTPLIKIILIILLVAAVLYAPVKMTPYLISISITVCFYAIMGLGLNLIVGLSGQLVFGYVAFYALGAYAFALLTAPKPFGFQINFWIALLFAVVAGAIGGFLIGLPTMNLRGDYLAIVTLGFAEIVRILINSNNFADYTGGPQGIKAIGQPIQPAFIEKILGKPLNPNVFFLYLVLLILFIVLIVVRNLQYSRTGRSWEAMREDETVSQACGVNTNSYKLLAVVIGAAIAGVAGALYASRNTYTGPAEYAFMVSVNALAVIVVGGMGSIPGTILGAFIIKGLPELLRDLESYRMLVFGALLIVMMVIRPEGLLAVKRRKLAVKPESIDVLKENMRQ